jgi:arsenite-transporting ATPase
MEIDPTSDAAEAPEGLEGAAGGEGGVMSGFSGMIKQFGNSIPGIDELLSFAELMRHVQRLEFDVTVFDTAPTGHTLRLLSLPGMIDNMLGKILGMRASLGPLLSAANSMMPGSGLPTEAGVMEKLEEVKGVIDAVQARIHAPKETTFVCVCIPEFLSLYETERLVQELTKFDIDTHCIVVNQVLFTGGEAQGACPRCAARSRMQQKYLAQIGDLYEDFHVVRTPLLNEEVRGPEKLRAFGRYLLKEYKNGEALPEVLCAGGGGGGGAPC